MLSPVFMTWMTSLYTIPYQETQETELTAKCMLLILARSDKDLKKMNIQQKPETVKFVTYQVRLLSS